MIEEKAYRRILWTAILLVLFAAVAVLTVRAQETDPLVGVWQGPVTGKPGTFQIYFTIAKSGGGAYTAKTDIPAQKARGIPVTEVRWTAPELFLDMSSFGITFLGRMDETGAKIEGRFKIGPEDLPLVLTHGGTVPEIGRPQEPRRPYPYREIEVSIPVSAAGITLAGTLTVPPGPGPFPAALLITGSGPHDRNESMAGHLPFLVLADFLTRQGLAVLRCDDRGCGKSTGDYHAATTADFAVDAGAAWMFLRERPEVRPEEVGLIGHSEGANIAAMVAAKTPGVAFAVMLAGMGVPGEELILSQTEAVSRSQGVGESARGKERAYNRSLLEIMRKESDPAAAEVEMKRLNEAYLAGLTDAERKELNVSSDSLALDVESTMPDYAWSRFLVGYDPRVDIGRMRCPVLALNGDKDTQVPADANLGAIERALGKSGNTRVKIRKLPGLNHLFQTAKTGSPREYGKIEETISPDVLKIIADWIRGLW
jgi:fermentation-respiration switch protein FrsA (DUF1100 family)